mgnify:CR=1 FL=1
MNDLLKMQYDFIEHYNEIIQDGLRRLIHCTLQKMKALVYLEKLKIKQGANSNKDKKRAMSLRLSRGTLQEFKNLNPAMDFEGQDDFYDVQSQHL